MRNFRISSTTQRGLKPNNFRKPGVRFTGTPASLSKVNENKEPHLHKRPQESSLRRHDDINLVIDYE
jgi:hypothetical protein